MPELTYGLDGNPVAPPLSPPPQNSPPPQSYTPEQIQGRINVLAPHFGVDPNFATAVARQESSFNPHATSPKGAQGIFQLMPDTAKSYGVGNSYDPDQNIVGGLKYLSDLQKKHQGDKYKTLVEYNSGPGNVNKKFEDLPDETQGYVTKILGPNAATMHGSSEQTYDLNGNPLDLSKSPIVQQSSFHKTPEQRQAYNQGAQVENAQSSLAGPIKKYAPEVLGIAGGALGSMVDAPNVGAAIGAGAGEMLASPNAVPTREDFIRALEGAASSYGLGKAFEVPGLLRGKFLKSPAEKASNLIEQTRQDITGGIPSGDVKGAQRELEAKMAPTKAEADANWEKVNSRMDKAEKVFDIPSGLEDTGIIDPSTGKSIVRPKFDQKSIRGPIKLSKDTIDYVNQERARLKTIIDSGVRDPNIGNAYQALDKVAGGLTTDKNGDTYIDFASAKALRSQIGASTSAEKQSNLTGTSRNLNLQRGSSVRAGLRDKLGDDIESSLVNLGGPDALDEYSKATGMTRTMYKASLFDKTLAKYTNYANGNLNTDAAINAFSNPTSDVATRFTQGERTRVVQMLQAVKNVSPSYDGALKFNNGAWTFYSAMRHPFTYALSIPSKYIYQKAIADPKFARVLTQLPSAPSKSPQASMLTKTVMRALQNAPAEMIAPSGMRIKDAHIDENGNAKPDFQMGAAQ